MENWYLLIYQKLKSAPLRSNTTFANWMRPLKLMKNAFYFMLEALFSFSRYLHFCLDFLVMQENGLIRKIAKVNFKIYDVTTC